MVAAGVASTDLVETESILRSYAVARCSSVNAAECVLMRTRFELDEAVSVNDDLDVVVFPEFVDGATGIYRAELIPLKKSLIEAGLRADYLHSPDRRTWLRERSEAEIVMNIFIGIATSGSVALLQSYLKGRRKELPMKLRIVTARKVSGQTSWGQRIIEFEGRPEDVGEALASIQESEEGDDQ